MAVVGKSGISLQDEDVVQAKQEIQKLSQNDRRYLSSTDQVEVSESVTEPSSTEEIARTTQSPHIINPPPRERPSSQPEYLHPSPSTVLPVLPIPPTSSALRTPPAPPVRPSTSTLYVSPVSSLPPAPPLRPIPRRDADSPRPLPAAPTVAPSHLPSVPPPPAYRRLQRPPQSSPISSDMPSSC